LQPSKPTRFGIIILKSFALPEPDYFSFSRNFLEPERHFTATPESIQHGKGVPPNLSTSLNRIGARSRGARCDLRQRFHGNGASQRRAFSIEAALLNSMGPPDNLILPESHEPANDLAKFDSLWFAW
jgi:hypothetical protein